MPAYWYDRAAAIKRDEEVGGDFNVRIVADKKPRFMNYRYPEQMAEFNSYITKTSCACERQFGKTIDELISGEDWSEEEDLFVHWYYKKLPVGVSGCTMNNVCSCVEAELSKIKDRWKEKSSDFSYEIYRSDSEYSRADHQAICKLVDQYKDEIEKCAMMAKRDHLDQDEASARKERIIERLVADCFAVCNDEKMLCNLMLDATYGRNRAYQFAWSVCGGAIVENLLNINSRTIKYIEQSADGEIEYGGNRYTARYKEVEDEYGDSTK